MNRLLSWWRRRPLIDITAARRLDVKPGDVLVLKTPMLLSPEQIRDLKRQWDSAQLFPESKLVFLQHGFDLEVIRQERAAP